MFKLLHGKLLTFKNDQSDYIYYCSPLTSMDLAEAVFFSPGSLIVFTVLQKAFLAPIGDFAWIFKRANLRQGMFFAPSSKAGHVCECVSLFCQSAMDNCLHELSFE